MTLARTDSSCGPAGRAGAKARPERRGHPELRLRSCLGQRSTSGRERLPEHPSRVSASSALAQKRPAASGESQRRACAAPFPPLEAPPRPALLARPAAVASFRKDGGAQRGAEEPRRRTPVASMAEPEPDPLSGRSLPELREMLRRQERLLADRALVSRLPDGGQRVRGCAARLRAAVAAREEQRRSGGSGFPGPTEPPPSALALGGLSLGAPGGAAARGLRGAGV
ncbi:protein GRINL1A [Candoia aspera]|uniref:protein GRINL1A n=1 Tax=Candoia aspera TaxID=51853 RepID=UPI002FD8165B